MSDTDLTISPATSSLSPAPYGVQHRTQHAARGPARRRPIPRKGHTKSRAGCPNCKRRKVKCDEVTPVCGPCNRLSLGCEYSQQAAANNQAVTKRSVSPSSSVSQSLSPHAITFDMSDLRFFQHFLINAYPPLPVGGRAVWQYISQISYGYEFLVHSMLGLGASHLSLLVPSTFNRDALRHRVTAIKQLNEFLSRPNLSLPDTEAAFASILALTFQAAHMPDGLADFLTMTRGCFLVGTCILSDLEKSAFRSFAREMYIEKAVENMASDRHRLPILDQSVADGFADSIERLGPLCHSVCDIEHLVLMRSIITSATSDLYESYRQHSYLHEKAGGLKADEFADFIDPKNHIARLVILHMLLLDCIMSGSICVWDEEAPTVAFQGASHRYDARNVMSVMWIENIYKELPAQYRPYAEWGVGLARQLRLQYRADSSFWSRPSVEEGGAPPKLHLGTVGSVANAL